MLCLDSYIVRIYRRDEKDPRRVVGIVEDVGSEKGRPFRNFDELREILTPLPRAHRGKGKGRNRETEKG